MGSCHLEPIKSTVFRGDPVSDLDGTVNEDVNDGLTLEQRALLTAAIQLLTAWIEGSEKIRAAISSDDAGYIDLLLSGTCQERHVLGGEGILSQVDALNHWIQRKRNALAGH